MPDPKIIANHSNEFFVNIGRIDANDESEESTFFHYFNTQHTTDKFQFKHCTCTTKRLLY